MSIKCKTLTNTSCLKCDKLEKEMVLIGSFVMCKECWEVEFNTNEITIDSEIYKNYKKWNKKYMNSIFNV